MATTFSIDPEYGWVLLSAIALAFECLLIGFFFPGRIRGKVFNEKFMKEHFKDQKKGGYPDMGNGRFSDKLSFDDWMLFNNAQRAHYNFLESITANILMILVAGLYYPCWTAYLTAVLIVGRLIYAIGYTSKGPNGRMVGALLIDLGLLAHLALSVLSSWNIIKGVQPEHHHHH